MVDSKVNVDCFQEEKDSKVSWIDARLSRVPVEKTLTKVEFSKMSDFSHGREDRLDLDKSKSTFALLTIQVK